MSHSRKLFFWERDTNASTWGKFAEWEPVEKVHFDAGFQFSGIDGTIIYLGNALVNEQRVLDGALIRQWDFSKGNSIGLSHDDRLLAQAYPSMGLRIFNRFSQQQVLEDATPNIYHPVFLDNDRIVLTALTNGLFRAWHLPSGESLGTISFSNPNPNSPGRILEFASDENMIAIFENHNGTYDMISLGASEN